MTLVKVNWNPPAKDLRVFAIACLVFAALLGAWLHWRHGASLGTAGIVTGIGALACATGLFAPRAIRPLYVVLMAVALPVGLALSAAVLAVLFFLVLTPIGLVMRLLGRDAMHRRFDPQAKSYWVARPLEKDVKRYFRQF